MRVKDGEYINEIEEVWIRTDDIVIKQHFYQTGEQTKAVVKQLLEKGYADLSPFKRIN